MANVQANLHRFLGFTATENDGKFDDIMVSLVFLRPAESSYKLLKINFVLPDDDHFVSSKFDVDSC